MITIIKQRLKEQRNSVIVYTLALSGYLFMLVSLFPSLQKMDIQAVMDQMPEQMTKFFGNSDLLSAYSTLQGYLSMEFLGFFFILVVSFYVGSAAGTAIAGQIEKHTMDFNLSQPISRTKIILGESLVALLYSLVIIACTSFVLFAAANIFNISINNHGILLFVVGATFFMWAIYGIALLLSSVLRSKMTVMLLTFGFALGSYVFLSLTRMIDKIKDWDNISIFKLYDPQKLLDGIINWNHIIILAVILLFGLLGTIAIFNKKDI